MRNAYGAIQNIPDWVTPLLNDCQAAGAWTTGIESDNKQRGMSINVDLYSYDEARGLAIVQIRQCRFRPNRYNKIRKDYYLIGRNEQGKAFAHPVNVRASGRVVGDGVTAGVRLALSRIWDCRVVHLDDIVRNGDVAFVPVPNLPEGAQLVAANSISIRDSHHVQGLADGKIYSSGKQYYVVGRAKIEHTKHQHSTVRVKNGVWRVQAGLKARTWGFTAPTVD